MQSVRHFLHYLSVVLCSWAIVGTLACQSSILQKKPSAHSGRSHTGALLHAAPSVEQQLLASLKTAEGLGEGNPLLMSHLYSLAMFYRQQGDYEKAEQQYQRALLLKERIAGPNHPDIATILYKYAALLRDANRYREAENLVARANAIMAHYR